MKHDLTHAKGMDALLKRLFPLCRSLTGNGVRETLRIVRGYIPIVMHEIPSGTKAFDWTIPKEWNIRDAYIKDPSGKKIIDFKRNNVHVMSYSVPIRATMPLKELKKYLHSLPSEPGFIPYKTSYYRENWGFCLTHRQLKTLKEGSYEVVIDSSLKDGSLTYGELFIPGKTENEVLISTYVCHPSMANDNLSGVVLATFLARALMKEKSLRYSYRFLFIPETIGAIAWLSKNRASVRRIKHGLVATCVGDKGPFTYKKTRAGDAAIDRIVEKVLKDSGKPYSLVNFFPWGSDERQYNSPGFNLPVGSLMRSMYGTFPEYHTSGDNLRFVRGKYIAETLELYRRVLVLLDRDTGLLTVKKKLKVRRLTPGTAYRSGNPYGEPQLGKRGLYGASDPEAEEKERALLWLMAYADGAHSLSDITARSGTRPAIVAEAAKALLKHKLLKPSRLSSKRRAIR